MAGPQLDAAIDPRPDLVSISAGGNDILRPKVDIEEVTDTLEDALIRIRETGADVLMVTSPNVRDDPVVGRINPRMAEYSTNFWGVATRHECYVLDLWNLRALRDPRLWPRTASTSPRGHARIARQAAYSLGVSDDAESWAEPPHAADALTRWETIQANRAWARTRLRPWIARRMRGQSSGDGITLKRPTLTPIEELAAG